MHKHETEIHLSCSACKNKASQRFSSFFFLLSLWSRPGEDEPVQVDPLLLGDPGGPVQPLGRLQHLAVEPLDQLLLRRHIQPLLLQVVGQSVDVWLHHLDQLTQAELNDWGGGGGDDEEGWPHKGNTYPTKVTSVRTVCMTSDVSKGNSRTFSRTFSAATLWHPHCCN